MRERPTAMAMLPACTDLAGLSGSKLSVSTRNSAISLEASRPASVAVEVFPSGSRMSKRSSSLTASFAVTTRPLRQMMPLAALRPFGSTATMRVAVRLTSDAN